MNTPLTLRDAINEGITNGPLTSIADSVHDRVREFFTQRVTAALVSTKTADEEIALRQLWRSVIGSEIPTNELTKPAAKGITGYGESNY